MGKRLYEGITLPYARLGKEQRCPDGKRRRDCVVVLVDGAIPAFGRDGSRCGKRMVGVVEIFPRFRARMCQEHFELFNGPQVIAQRATLSRLEKQANEQRRYRARMPEEHLERQREHQRAYIAGGAMARWRAENPQAYRAHEAFRNAVRSGRLKAPDACEECGSTVTLHGHHATYLKPLEIEWLCPFCHAERPPGINGRLESPETAREAS